MKLLFTRFPLESSLGGAEIQTISLMKGLTKKGHAVAFVGSCPTLLKLTREEGIPSVKMEIGPPPVSKWHALSFLWRKQKMQHQLEQTLEQFQELDAVFMLSLSEKILLTPLALKKGLKVFWIEHDRVGAWLEKNPWLPKLREMSESVTTVAVSNLSKKIYEGLGFKNVVAIPNGIDLQRFASSEVGPLSPSPFPRGEKGSLLFGCISRLTEDKGVDMLIEAIKDIPEIDLTIVGTGRDEGYLRTLIGSDAERINILPRVADLGTFYRSLDALILPSRDHDPFGLVAAEAMSLGVPVIVTDATGIADELQSGTDAIVVAANDVAALTRGIRELMDEAMRKRIGTAGKQTAEVKFGLAKMIDAYEGLLG